MSVSTTQNCLLRSLAPEDLARLLRHCERVEVRKGEALIHQDHTLKFTYFPESGLSWNLAKTRDGRKIEVGCFGFEGMVSSAPILGSDLASHDVLIQVGGAWLRMRTDILKKAVQASPALQAVFLRYVQVQNLALSYSTLANGAYAVRERLARWLLMAHDRLEGDELALTHESLSLFLGVRRAGVTTAIRNFEGLGMIQAKRGLITVLDRDGLLALAGDSYGIPEAEYERLIGPFRDKRPVQEM